MYIYIDFHTYKVVSTLADTTGIHINKFYIASALQSQKVVSACKVSRYFLLALRGRYGNLLQHLGNSEHTVKYFLLNVKYRYSAYMRIEINENCLFVDNIIVNK